jgi:large subunit ribosomal protein L16
MLAPKKIKHRKWHKSAGTSGRVASRMLTLDFGDYGLKATTGGWVSARQIESVRRVMVRYIRKGGKIWVRAFPFKPVTAKGSEVPMGKGKGTVDHYVAAVLPGQILFEIAGIPEDQAQEAVRLSGHKLNVRSKFIKK